MIRHKGLKHLHIYTDRHGKKRIYFRARGKPLIALPEPLYSEDFYLAYRAAITGATLPMTEIGANKTKAGSLDALIAQYYKSSAFTSTALSTREGYRRVLENLRREHGDKPVASIKAKHLDAILGKIAERSRSQASNTRKRLYTLMRLAVKWEYREDNPVMQAEKIHYKRKGWRTWTEDDIAKFREHWPIGSKQRTAMEILLNTGLRRSDAVRLGPQHVKDGWIKTFTQKSGETVQIEIPVLPELAPHLNQTPKDALAFIITEYGASRSEKAFTNWIIEAARNAGLPPRSSPHGLRKSACVRLVHAGCSLPEIMAITGHQNAAELQPYIKEFDRKRSAQSAANALNANTTKTKTG